MNRMSQIFRLPVDSHRFSGRLNVQGNYPCMSKFAHVEQAVSAAHAINCHDNLVESLQNLVSLLQHPSADERVPEFVVARKALMKANGESDEKYYEDKNRDVMYSLHIYMDTDDDAEILYDGVLYSKYGQFLTLTESFRTRKEALDEFSKVRVLAGDKASDFTHNWLTDAAIALGKGEEAEYIAGNQTYNVSITEIEAVK